MAASPSATPIPVEDSKELSRLRGAPAAIAENYRELRERLREFGHVFTSETDAETVSHLIRQHAHDGGYLVEVVRTRLAFHDLG